MPAAPAAEPGPCAAREGELSFGSGPSNGTWLFTPRPSPVLQPWQATVVGRFCRGGVVERELHAGELILNPLAPRRAGKGFAWLGSTGQGAAPAPELSPSGEAVILTTVEGRRPSFWFADGHVGGLEEAPPVAAPIPEPGQGIQLTPPAVPAPASPPLAIAMDAGAPPPPAVVATLPPGHETPSMEGTPEADPGALPSTLPYGHDFNVTGNGVEVCDGIPTAEDRSMCHVVQAPQRFVVWGGGPTR